MHFIPHNGERRVSGMSSLVRRRGRAWAVGSFVLNTDLSSHTTLVWEDPQGTSVQWTRLENPHVEFAAVPSKPTESDEIWKDIEFSEEWYTTAMDYPPCAGETSKPFRYLGVAAKDEPWYPLARHFDDTEAFLSLCAEEQRRVLVHCIMGRNRSVAIAANFLVRKRVFSLYDAIDLMSQRRERVLHNDHFMGLLVKDSVRLSIPIR